MTRRAQTFFHDKVVLAYDHVEVTADLTVKLAKMDRAFRLDKAQYINVTGFAAHSTDYYTIKVLKTSTVMASWSAQTTGGSPGGQGSITANTFMDLVLSSTDADLVTAADEVLSLFLDRASPAATLPAGRIVLHGRYV